MKPIRVVAVVLTLLGIVALAYGGFSYPSETHTAQVGNISLSVRDQRTVNVPVWAGVGAIVIGLALLLVPAKKLL